MTLVEAWVAAAAREKLVRQQIDLGPLSAEDVEVAVEHCGLRHSDLSKLNNEWGFSQFPAVLGHEVIGRIVAVGSAARELQVGERVGIGWNAASCMHCRQ
jgi:alcohol/geraniol dehydrogenase (NADP+)